MHILIVEDEGRIAKLLISQIREVWGDKAGIIALRSYLEDARNYLVQNEIDVLFLDLNLHGQNGFDLLQEMLSRPFYTVIVSAYTEQAIQAFEYGVLDFVPKPFNRERLHKTFDRLLGKQSEPSSKAKFIIVKSKGKLTPVSLQDIWYIQADGHYGTLHLQNRQYLCDKPLDQLEKLLPDDWYRCHRSYLVDTRRIREIRRFSGSKYQVVLNNNRILPLARGRVKGLEGHFY